MTTNALLDGLGGALAAINNAGAGGFAFSYNATNGALSYSTGVTFNGTQPQITGVVSTFNALATDVLSQSLSMTLIDALGVALASANRPVVWNGSTHQLATNFNGSNYMLTPGELAGIHAAFNPVAVLLVGAPPPPPEPAVLPRLGFNTHRLSLCTDVTVYCNASTGSNTTGDGTATRPFKHAEHVYDLFMADYDLRRRKVTVLCQASMGFVNLAGRQTGIKDHTYFKISSANPAAPVSVAGFMVSADAMLWLTDFFITAGSDAVGLGIYGGAVFGGGLQFQCSSARAGLYAIGNKSDFSQYGGALTFTGSGQSCIIGENLSLLNCGGEIAANGTFGAFTRANFGAECDLTNAAPSGSISGLKADAHRCGQIWTGGGGVGAWPGTGISQTAGGVVG